MNIFWQDRKGRGEIDGRRITQKPALNFEFEYLLVKNDYSEYTPKDAANYSDVEINRDDMEAYYVNRPLTDAQRSEVDRFYRLWTPPVPAAAQSIEDAKAIAIEKLNAKINIRLASIVSKYPDREAHTWPTSLEESRALLVDSNADAILVRAAAQESGMTPTDLAQVIVANANAFASASGQIVGLRIKIKEMIKAATTVDEIDQALELLQ